MVELPDPKYQKLQSRLKELESTAKRYKALFDSSSDILVQLDAAGTIVDLNPQAEVLSGYKREEIIGKNLKDMMGKFTAPSLALMIANFATRKQGVAVPSYEVEAIGSDGQKIYFEITTAPLKGIVGKESGELGVMHDITKRKQAEIELKQKVNELEEFYQLTIGRENKMIELENDLNVKDKELENSQETASLIETKYETLVKHIPGMVYFGKPDWSVEILANSENVCGYPVKEFKENIVNWVDIIYGEDKERVLAEAAALIKTKGPLVQKYRIIAKDGSIRTIEDHKSPVFTFDGKYDGVYGFVFLAPLDRSSR